jgi:putative acetyltransferase
MIVRKETESDVGAIFNITKLAFENHPYSNNTEQFIINALRSANALTISLVAEIDGKLVGHIAFSPVTIWPPILGKDRKMGSLSDGSKNWYGMVSVRSL